MTDVIQKAEDDNRIDADDLSDGLTPEAARIARKLTTSFGTRRVTVYDAEPLHLGIYGKKHSASASMLAYLQIGEKMAITVSKRRSDPEPGRCETDDGMVSYIETRPVEHVAGLYNGN